MKQKIKNLSSKILNLIFPENIKCMFCGEELNQNSYNCTCEECLNTLPFISRACSRCGTQLNEEEYGVCFRCKTKNYNFVEAKAVFEYKDLPLQVVHNLKYNNKRYLIKYIVKYLVDFYGRWNLFADYVTYVPMFSKKEKERGFNQAKLMAENFAIQTEIPFINCCEKIKDTRSQTNLNSKERMENIKDCFKFKSEYKKDIKNKTVLIIDDIVTTGATTSELSKVLLSAGASSCYVLSFAHTQLLPMQTETTNN
ncbi:MAG: ComF family protein [Clostridia bacterium]|nr:ComF family protein [Clostridia bacterium]